jgi:excisionase family DNA binding protein
MLTPKEIATELKVKEQTVMKWLREGTLKGVKLGKLWRVKEEDYKKFIEQGTPKGDD